MTLIGFCTPQGRRRRCFAVAFGLSVMIGLLLSPPLAIAQATQQVSFGGGTPFVTSVTPVFGASGLVGGVEVNPQGVIEIATHSVAPELAVLRQHAIEGLPGELRRFNPRRKISLRRLNAEIGRQLNQSGKLSAEVLHLAGMQAVEWVLVYPDRQDLVLVGPAEGWKFVDEAAVGTTTGAAVLRLDDLLDAMHSSFAVSNGEPIRCSIDPSPEGTRRLSEWMRTTKLTPGESYRQQMEQQMGEQSITLAAIRPDSHFARVLIGADYRMKRIAMDLEPSPIRRLPSYLQMLTQRAGNHQLASPRFWLSATCDQVRRDPAGLAWQLDGVGVTALTEQSLFDAQGQAVPTGQADPVASRWCQQFTASYGQVGKEIPVFDQLRGCINLALVSALILKEDLTAKARCPLPWLTDPEQLVGESFRVATAVPSQAKLTRQRRGWVASVSGGVELDSWNIVQKHRVAPSLGDHLDADAPQEDHWWWD